MSKTEARVSTSKIVPVILCGGSGTRLWPASREKHPKQFLNLMGDFSLLQDTMKRALRISGAPAENLVTVTLGALSEGVRTQLAAIQPEATKHILSEPFARDTAAAVAFAAHYVKKNFGADAIMWVLPADHHIGDEHAMSLSFAEALTAARQNYLVTFGIRPTRPETGYGYILLGNSLMSASIFNAESFVEKPNLATAKEYIESGKYLWNSGMFVFSAGNVLKNFEKYAKDVNDAVVAAMDGAAAPTEVRPDLYAAIEKKPFDKAIMEKSNLVAVVPCDPEWSDIGSWESLWEIRPKDINGNVTEGQAACFETKNCLVQARDRLIACAGVQNIVVIETDDAILIADRSNGDAMKVLVNSLKSQGRREVQDVPVANDTQDYGVKELTAFTGEALTFTGTSNTCRFLTIVEGKALVSTVEGQKYLSVGETVFIQSGMVYNVKNVAGGLLKMIEVNKGLQGETIVAAPKLRNVA